MPVFDFNNTPDKDKPLTCTYTTFRSDESTATPECPMLVLDNKNVSGNIIPADSFLIRRNRRHLNLKRKMVSYPRIFCRSMPVLSAC